MAEFGEAAGRLAGQAGWLLGWRPGEFWAATPAELASVVRAMSGEGGEALSGEDVEALKRMLERDPSTACGGLQHRVDHAPHGRGSSGGRPNPVLRSGEDQ